MMRHAAYSRWVMDAHDYLRVAHDGAFVLGHVANRMQNTPYDIAAQPGL